MVRVNTNCPSVQNYTSWFSFKCTILPRLSCLLLFPVNESLLQLLTWSILIIFPWLLSVFYFTKFVRILWFSAATTRLSISHFKFAILNFPLSICHVHLCSLLTCLVCLKYYPSKSFLSHFYKRLYFLFVFTIVVASRSCILSPWLPVSVFHHYHDCTLFANSAYRILPSSFLETYNLSTLDLGWIHHGL